MNDWHKSPYSGGATNCVEVSWTKSSYSSGATNCVEVGWRKSSYSLDKGNCVEVADGTHTVHVRDTQHRHLGSLSVPTDEWRAFVHALRAEEL